MQVCGAGHAGMGSSCRYVELVMQVWGAHAGMWSWLCRYGELMQVWGAHAGMWRWLCRYGELMQVRGAHAGMGSSCRYVELMQVRGAHAGMGSSCRYGELMQVWGAHAGMGSSCRYGELMQVCGAHAGTGSLCKYGELMQVWGAHAGMGSSCRYGELVQIRGARAGIWGALHELQQRAQMCWVRRMGHWCLLFVMFRVHVYLTRLSLSVNYYKVEISTLTLRALQWCNNQNHVMLLTNSNSSYNIEEDRIPSREHGCVDMWMCVWLYIIMTIQCLVC